MATPRTPEEVAAAVTELKGQIFCSQSAAADAKIRDLIVEELVVGIADPLGVGRTQAEYSAIMCARAWKAGERDLSPAQGFDTAAYQI